MSLWYNGKIGDADDMNKMCNVGLDADVLDGTEVPTVIGEAIFAWDSGIIYFSGDGERWTHKLPLGNISIGTIPASFLILDYTNISQVQDSTYTTNRVITTSTTLGRSQVGGALGDNAFLFFYASGTETKLEITTVKNTDSPIWELVHNGTTDGGGTYDDYAASPTVIDRNITLTGTVLPGLNIIRLRSTGNTAPSTGYTFHVLGASLT